MARRPISGLRTIVTGATSGIGRALVVELVRRGAMVVAMGRRDDRLQSLVAELNAPNNYRFVVGDVTRPEDRVAVLETTKRELGGLDALVNNAGAGVFGMYENGTEAQLRRIMEVNFFAPALFMREALPLLKAGDKPIIVNVASVLAHRAVPEKSEYCASKFALHGLTDAVRIELGQHGIDMLLVCPSTTRTEFFDVAEGKMERPLDRFGAMSPEAVAQQTVRAIAAGKREIIISFGGKALVWLDRLWPSAADWFIARWV
jgi:short-subunit dehydrogenase